MYSAARRSFSSSLISSLFATKLETLKPESFGCLVELKGRYGHVAEHMRRLSPNLGMNLGLMNVKRAFPSTPYALHFIHSDSRTDNESVRNFRSMNFIRGIIEEDRKDFLVGSPFSRYTVEKNPDIVHIKLMRNNTFITITDSEGNKKAGASAGSLAEMKGGAKVSRYAAEATAEHVGRVAKKLGMKSVVMKVKGFTYFKKKRQAIMSWRDGFTNSRGDQNPVVYVEDTTRRAHNGCRLPKRRRV